MDQNWYNIGQRPKFESFDPTIHKVRWGERKHNGHRYTLIKYPDGDLRAYGARAINTFLAIPRYIQDLFSAVPVGTVFDGEFVAESDEASDVTHLLANASPRLQFRVFSVPYLAGEDNRSLRRDETDLLFAELKPYGFETVSLLDVEECLLEKAIEQKIEGFVLKSRHYSGWYKYKPKKTSEVFVVGALHGLGKNANRWGSLIVAVYKDGKKTVVGQVGKGKDELWRDEPFTRLLGRVCEISHEGLQTQGKLKFSAFLRWREDKDPETCVYEQLL